MNKSILLGRLTSDPEIRYTQGDQASCIARFTVAADRKYKKQGEESVADFINCVAFGKTGEFVEKYFAKGDKILVCGRLQSGSYTNKDGVKVYTVDIIVEEVDFAGEKRNQGDNLSADSAKEAAISANEEDLPWNK